MFQHFSGCEMHEREEKMNTKSQNKSIEVEEAQTLIIMVEK